MASIPDSAVGFLLQNVADFINTNYELITGSEETFNKLQSELEVLKAFVQQGAEKYSSAFLDSVADRITALVHNAEDAVETFIVETSKHKLRGTFNRLLHEGEYKLRVRNLAKEIDSVSKEIQYFYSTAASVGFETLNEKYEELGEEETKNLKLPSDDTVVVGLQDETEKFIDLLTKGTEQLDVISIVGMYGLGKTTLAKKVFNDEQIEFHFCVRAFVEVSQDFKRKEVFLKIIHSFGEVTQDIQMMSEDKLADYIIEYLEKRNYLIVLDDVWTIDAWNQVKCAFPSNNKRSRVLITTRAVEVAACTREVPEPHVMRLLDKGEAQDLLRLKVFNDKNYCLPDELEDSEILILGKCKGLPLQILLIASTLRNHPKDPRWWKQVAEGLQDCDPWIREGADYVIKLSFDCLPHHLKPCFLYLGIFPQNSEISARTLLRLWVSEGLIAPGDGSMSLEAIAAFYLRNLVNRSLVMVQKRDSNDKVKTITIQSTLRDFCKVRAMKENLFREINMAGPKDNMSTYDDRRLCINSNLPDYIYQKPIGNRVRSFLSFAKEDYTLPLEKMSSLLRAFNLLRVLDIRSIKLTRFPVHLCYLVLLRYLAICGELGTLPVKIISLWNLQTLIVQIWRRTVLDIKPDIWRMGQLRHLETNASAILLRTRDGPRNPNLQTLSTISPESCSREFFERAPMLKKLGIRGKLVQLLDDGHEDGRLFSGLENLENLKLLNATAEKIREFPSCNLFPSKLAKLTLLNTLLDWKHMSTLGKLPNLQVLKLKDDACEGKRWSTEDGGFKSLKVLHIGKTDLNVWKTSSSHFPVLTRLYLKHCTKLKEIPEDLHSIPTLQTIDLYFTNNSVVASARRLQVAKIRSEIKFKLFVCPPDE